LASQVSKRGQITIQRDARRALSVKPGMVTLQVVVDKHLEVYFIPVRHRRSLFGALPLRTPGAANEWQELEE
jgi:bifunctional DNA-binding transcriptional regulator/antitoxin component of YhaV-PrlF toxin-antitoxin module